MSESLGPVDAASLDWLTRPNTFKVGFDTTRAINYKFRFYVVLRVFEGIYQALPIFTKSGKGLANVPASEHANYLSIQDHRAKEFEKQNEGLPVLKTEEMDQGTVILHPKSVVMFNGPCTLFGHHPLEIHGRLTAHGTAVLLQHCRRYEWEAVEEPTAEMIAYLEAGLWKAEIAHQEFAKAVTLNPNHGREYKNGNRQRTPSPPSQLQVQPSRAQSSSTSDVQYRVPSRGFRHSSDETPSPMALGNSFGALAVVDEDETASADENPMLEVKEK